MRSIKRLHYVRYTDFLVNEILLSGAVVHLDNLRAPKYGNKKPQNEQPDQTSPNTPAAGSIDVSKSVGIGPFENSDNLSQTAKSAVSSPEISKEESAKNETLDPAQSTAQESSKQVTTIANGSTGTLNASSTKDTSIANNSVAQWQAYASKPKGIKVRSQTFATLSLMFLAYAGR